MHQISYNCVFPWSLFSFPYSIVTCLLATTIRAYHAINKYKSHIFHRECARGIGVRFSYFVSHAFLHTFDSFFLAFIRCKEKRRRTAYVKLYFFFFLKKSFQIFRINLSIKECLIQNINHFIKPIIIQKNLKKNRKIGPRLLFISLMRCVVATWLLSSFTFCASNVPSVFSCI